MEERMTLDNYLKWFQSHERLLLVALVMGFGAWGFNHWVDRSAESASNKAAVAAQIAVVQHDADVKIAAVVAQQTAQFQQESVQREAEMARLLSQMASRDAASNNRVTAVTQPKTPSQAVVDLQSTYTLNAPVAVTADGADVPVADLQQFTVAKIEGDTAKADLVDTKKELDSTQQLLASAIADWDASRNQVAGLNAEIKTTIDAKDAEIKAVKATARKSKRNWFIAGFVTGFVARHFVNF
jgi:autotransporter translocation and assembly factor TamB